MMEPAKDRMRDNVSEPLDRACVDHLALEQIGLITMWLMHGSAPRSRTP